MDVACEVEVGTRSRRRTAGQQTNKEFTDTSKRRKTASTAQTPKRKPRRKPAPRQSGKPGAKRLTKKKNKRPLLSPEQLNKIKKIDRAKLLATVTSRVEGELFGELFPERTELWEHLKSGNRLLKLVTLSAEKLLYDECSTICDKDAELFLRWLDVMRSLTCKEGRAKLMKQTLLMQVLESLMVVVLVM